MNDHYHVLEVLNADLARLDAPGYGRQLWSRGQNQRRTRQRPCCRCGKPVGTSSFRPLTNTSNRSDRMCSECTKALVAKATRATP